MAQHTLPYHPKSNAYIPSFVSANFAFCREIDIYRQPTFLRRNLRAFLAYHTDACKRQPTAKGHSTWITDFAVRDSADVEVDDSSTANALQPSYEDESDHPTPLVNAISQDALLAKTMDPDFEAPSRRSVRHLTQRIYDDDESELTLAPLSIRKKINFSKNRPPEEERPRKRIKTDRSVKRTKCHCTLTIWDNRDGIAEAAAALIETHMSCMAVWSHTERYGHVVDIEMDKPFRVRAGALKVPTQRKDERTLGISENYFLEFKIWPSSDKAEWPPVPLLGKTDGDVNRPNRFAHNILSGSLVAKYNNLPRQPEADTPLSLFYLDESGAMLRTKYGLEVSGDWRAARITQSPPPLRADLAWAVDDDDQFLGRNKKRPRAESSPKTPPRRRKQLKSSSQLSKKQPKIRYLWEADPSQSHLAQNEYQTTQFEGLYCPACPTYEAGDLLELRFHFLSSHSRFNFILCEEDYNHSTGLLCDALFRVSSTAPSKRRLEIDQDRNNFYFEASTSPFDLATYLGGDSSWTGESPAKSSYKSRIRSQAVRFDSFSGQHSPPSFASAIPDFVPDPLAKLRNEHNGRLPPKHVPEFRVSDRKKHKPVSLIRHTGDNRTLTYDSITHRPTHLSEDAMSETDDERDDQWYIQRHLETLAVDAETYGRSDQKQELFRRWDKHRLEERLDHIEFLSESLVRFVRRNRNWLRHADESLHAAWAHLIGNLKEDRLLDTDVIAGLQNMLLGDDQESSPAEAQTQEDSKAKGKQVETLNPASPSDQLEGAVTVDADVEPATPRAVVATEDPNVALEQLRTKLLLTPPDRCGICQGNIKPELDSIRCAARDCASSGVFFHLKCVRLGNKRAGWSCMACKSEARLKQERDAKGKRKGKAVYRTVNS
ncbi:uncharacterized protein HMPREF1541_02132 [Cyphellophora europaea CBS 101466]|uniref:Zinc finger PHD-type domain-containing protein n=1 Tax=Cyphellophora europaea (strain CBS 101466) TaxID=1220924 RepID=W2S4V2_CYPE1|nr:uncharacterized protein HMPREF1541_02132 [Cyphellophora europaea CBS 101466]ETN42974.1 hypothetical protein HMPREF1541_02132 [Cyphellophora europaea CBS 101466]